MLLSILGFLTGLAGPLTNLANKITDLQIAKVRAGTDVQKAELAAQIEEVHDKRAVLVAEAGTRVGQFIFGAITFLIALGPTTYLLKIFLWDKVIGAFVGCVGPVKGCKLFMTDNLDSNLWWVVTAVVSLFMVTSTIRKIPWLK